MREAIAGFALLLIGSSVHAAVTADQLVKQCTVTPTAPKEAFEQIRCAAYIDGLVDAHGVLSSLSPSAQLYCTPPKGISIETAIDALVEWVRSHPDKAETPGRSAVFLALRDRYPCRQ